MKTKARYIFIHMQIIVSLILLIVSACTGAPKEDATHYPGTVEEERRERQGKITGEEGWSIFGGKSEDKSGAAIGVNSFLWRATLDTLSFAPIASADPLGGVIITEWYENPDARGERFKINATIMDTRLRADAIKIAVFKQVLNKGEWRDDKVSPKVARDLEDKVLTRARELRIKNAK